MDFLAFMNAWMSETFLNFSRNLQIFTDRCYLQANLDAGE